MKAHCALAVATTLMWETGLNTTSEVMMFWKRSSLYVWHENSPKVLPPAAQNTAAIVRAGQGGPELLPTHKLPVGSSCQWWELNCVFTLLISIIHSSTLCSSFFLASCLFTFGLTLLIKHLITFIKTMLKDSSIRCLNKVSCSDKLKVSFTEPR